MKNQKYLLGFLLTTSFISASSHSEQKIESGAVASTVDRFAQRTKALANQHERIALEAQKIQRDKETAAARREIEKNEGLMRLTVEQAQFFRRGGSLYKIQ